MRTWPKLLPVIFALILAPACVCTGAREITKPALTSRLEAGKSSQAEVSALLGFPAIVTYGEQREETWNYYYVTEYPQAGCFIPAVNAWTDGFYQSTKKLTISFDRRGVVQNLQMSRATSRGEVFPY